MGGGYDVGVKNDGEAGREDTGSKYERWRIYILAERERIKGGREKREEILGD